MKTQFAFVFFFLSLGLGLSCSDNSIKKVCVDPLGSENITFYTCIDPANYTWCYNCFGGEVIYTNPPDTCRYSYCYELYAPTSSAARVLRSLYFTPHCQPSAAGSIVDFGLVSCLGEVNAKPSTGYVYTITPQLHHGYVTSFEDGTYGRFYIDSWKESSPGLITSLNVVRQYPF